MIRDWETTYQTFALSYDDKNDLNIIQKPSNQHMASQNLITK